MAADDSESRRLIGQLLVAAALAADPARAARMDHGMSGDLVFRLETAPPLYGKIGGGSRVSQAELGREIAVLAWLKGKALVPRLVWSGWVDGRLAMFTAVVDGAPLHELGEVESEASAIAAIQALAALHALPTKGCPFDERLDVKLAEAERRVAAGEVREDDLDADRAGLADRYQDLALFVRSGARNFPDLPVRALLAAHYPLAALDEAKLDFYRLLDEFY